VKRWELLGESVEAGIVSSLAPSWHKWRQTGRLRHVRELRVHQSIEAANSTGDEVGRPRAVREGRLADAAAAPIDVRSDPRDR